MPKFDWNDHQEVTPAVAAAAGPWAKYQTSSSDAQAGPWSKYATPVKPPEQTTAGQTALEGFGNAASMGYLPQLQALTSQLTPDPNKAVDEKLRSQGFSIGQEKPTYVSERDENIRRLQKEAEEHPGIAAGAGLAGGLTSAVAGSALAPINAASRIGRIAQAAKGGAIIGAIANPGDKEGEVTGLQFNQRLGGALTGAAVGGAGGAAVEGVSKAANSFLNLSNTLQSKAAERAFKSSGAMLKDYRQAAGQGRVEELGKFMLDNGLVKPGMTVEDIAKAAKALQDQKGSAVGGILQKLDDSGAAAPSADALASLVEKQAAPLKDFATSKPTYKALSDVAGDIKSFGNEPPIGVAKGEVGSLNGRGTEYLTDPQTGEVMAKFRNGKLMTESGPTTLSPEQASAATAVTPNNMKVEVPGTFKNAQDIKKFVSEQIEASGGWKSLNPTEKNLALRKVYSQVNQAIEDSAGSAATEAGDRTLLKDYVEAKSGYRSAKEINKIAADAGSRKNANRFASPSDYFTGGIGAVIGASNGEGLEGKLKGAALGAGAGLLNKGARSYGTPIVSNALYTAGKALARTPIQAIGELTAPALAAIERSPATLANVARVASAPKLEPKAAGETKWAKQGADRLGLSQTQASDLIGSPEGRRLLIEASDLSPGSERLQRIKDQLKRGAK